jgi:hypothetical protein
LIFTVAIEQLQIPVRRKGCDDALERQSVDPFVEHMHVPPESLFAGMNPPTGNRTRLEKGIDPHSTIRSGVRNSQEPGRRWGNFHAL